MSHFLTFIICIYSLHAFASSMTIPFKKMSVVIDPGHGGNDQGTSTLLNSLVIKESNLTLSLSQKILNLIKNQHADQFNISVTRENNKYIGLQKRVDFTLNENADLYLSFHYNSAFSESISGTEIYFPAGTTQNLANSLELSVLESIQKDLIETGRIKQSLSFAKILPAYWPAPKIKIRRASFYVLEKSHSAALLVEVGYLSNASEKNLLLAEHHQDQAAESIVKALVTYKEMSDKHRN